LLFIAALTLAFGAPAPGPRRSIGIGILFGALILTVPTFIFSFLFLMAWLAWRDGKAWMRSIVPAALAVALMLAPWLMRNYEAFGTPVFISSNSGGMLLMGNAATAGPNDGPNADITPFRAAATGMDEIHRDRYFAKEAIRGIANKPGRAARLYVLKFLNYFNYRNKLLTKTEMSAFREFLALATYGSSLDGTPSASRFLRAVCPDALRDQRCVRRNLLHARPVSVAFRPASAGCHCDIRGPPIGTGHAEHSKRFRERCTHGHRHRDTQRHDESVDAFLAKLLPLVSCLSKHKSADRQWQSAQSGYES
jgi:hypothetical protein